MKRLPLAQKYSESGESVERYTPASYAAYYTCCDGWPCSETTYGVGSEYATAEEFFFYLKMNDWKLLPAHTYCPKCGRNPLRLARAWFFGWYYTLPKWGALALILLMWATMITTVLTVRGWRDTTNAQEVSNEHVNGSNPVDDVGAGPGGTGDGQLPQQ